MAMPTNNAVSEMIRRLHKGPKSDRRKAMEIDLAKLMHEEAWNDVAHKDHLAAVGRVYNAYVKLHKTK